MGLGRGCRSSLVLVLGVVGSRGSWEVRRRNGRVAGRESGAYDACCRRNHQSCFLRSRIRDLGLEVRSVGRCLCIVGIDCRME